MPKRVTETQKFSCYKNDTPYIGTEIRQEAAITFEKLSLTGLWQFESLS